MYFPFLVAALAGAMAAAQAQTPAKDRIVVLLSIDGFPGWALEDEKLPVPTLRRLAREGAVARGMKVSNPSVTWPNHTTMVTGVPPADHGVLFNGMLIRQGAGKPPKVEPWRDKREMVRVPTVYDLAHKAGLTTAQVDWVAIQNPGTITWAFPEVPDPNGKIEREMAAEGIVTTKQLTEFFLSQPAWRDRVWTWAAAHILRKHRPNLLLFHLLNLDSAHHRYGPKTQASYTAMAFADDRVGEILTALESAGLKDKATLLIVSDHGFKTAERILRPNALLREEGLLRVEDGKVACDAYVIPEGGTAMVYVTARDKRAALLPRLKRMFTRMEGMEKVVEPAEFASLGLPSPESYDQMADLVLAARPRYAFSGAHDGYPVVEAGGAVGHHGYLGTDPDMNALFLAWGRGIRAGARLDMVDNLDVAPTIASLLKLRMEGTRGKALREILTEAAANE